MKKFVFAIALTMTATLLSAGNYSRANDIVTDNNSGLQWQDTLYSNADKNAYNSETTESNRARQWIHAAGYCNSLQLGGFDDWRLPAITELDAIVDKSHTNPALDPIFQNALGLGTWSGTTYPDNTSQAWGMGFDEGNRHHCTKNVKSKLIMCVRKGSGTPPANQAPVAKAGADQRVMEGDTVTLDGSGSTDPDGTITAYVWKEGGTTLSTKVSFDKIFSVGTHTVTLTVTDNDGATKSDNVTVTVESANQVPVAKAGADQRVMEGNTVTLDGSGSTDPDGTITAYVWKEGGTTLSRKVSFDKIFSVGKHTITLTVTDNDGATKSDNVTVTVESLNTPPTANAGPNISVQVNDTVVITGSGTDTDGTVVSYEWKKSGTVLADSASFDYTPTAVGADTLTLTVTDNDGATGTDSMDVVVSATPPPADTTPPVITLNGANPMDIIQDSTFTDPGASATDAVDGDVPVTVSGTVDTSKVGSYTLTYSAEDSAGNKAVKTRAVNITAESLPPVTEPDWFEETEIDGKMEYTIKDGKTSVVLDSGVKDDFDVKANDDMIFFTAKDSLFIGTCQVKIYITMKNDGIIQTGYTHEGSDCSNDIDTFASGTIVTVDNNGILRIDTLLTGDLVLGGK